MIHQWSIVHHYFPVNIQALQKNFLGKNGSIKEN